MYTSLFSTSLREEAKLETVCLCAKTLCAFCLGKWSLWVSTCVDMPAQMFESMWHVYICVCVCLRETGRYNGLSGRRADTHIPALVRGRASPASSCNLSKKQNKENWVMNFKSAKWSVINTKRMLRPVKPKVCESVFSVRVRYVYLCRMYVHYRPSTFLHYNKPFVLLRIIRNGLSQCAMCLLQYT